MSRKILILIIGLLSACSSERRGLAELRDLCAKDAGLKVYRVVETEGYYDSTASSGISGKLANEEFRYFEFCNASPSRLDILPEPGCYRVERVSRKGGECNQRIDRELSGLVVDPYPQFLSEFCVASRKIDRPEAHYSFHTEITSWAGEDGNSEFIKSDSYIKEISSGDILGEFISYSYNEEAGITAPRSCSAIDERFLSYDEADLVNNTFN